jgi:potassium efflux system protein
MPRSRNHSFGLTAAAALRGLIVPGNRLTRLYRALGIVVSAMLVLTLASGGGGPVSPAQPNTAQDPATAAPAPAATQNPAAATVETAVPRAETLEKLKSFEIAPLPDAATPAGTAGAGGKPGSASGAVTARLGRTPGSTAAADSTVSKPVRDLLEERLRLLDEHDRLSVALRQVTHPEPSPDSQAGTARAELDGLQRTLIRAAKTPETLLPAAFRGSPAHVSAAQSSEMKDALEAAANESKKWKADAEALRTEITHFNGQQNARHSERDRIFQRATNARSKITELEAAVNSAQTARARQLATDRLVNQEWEARVESLRLQVEEAQIALEAKLAEIRELKLHVCHSHVQIAERTLELMRARYGIAAEDHERDLKRAAAKEDRAARQSDDPLVRFRARRTAEMLVLEAQVVKSEQALATSPSPSPDEQRSLADHAEHDFARIKELLDDGRVSRLDAIRLNNDFRRIGPERDRLVRNEMATVEAQLQFYEDALTGVEIELIQDSLHDRFEHDLLSERVPAARWAEGEKLLRELERDYRALLIRRRIALEKLSDRASHTLQQIVRRLSILDEEYGFIRTHIFWVRDQDPIGLATVAQGARELNYLLNGLIRLAQETVKPNLWCQPSVEFMITALPVLALPVVLVRLRRLLGRRIRRELKAIPS